MSEIIIQKRITPPESAPNVIYRERLINLLNENISKSLILICSPAGFGKTTLVQNYLSNQKNKFTWYHVSNDSNDFYTFFSYLVYSLKRINNQFGKITIQILEVNRQNYQMSKEFKSIAVEVIGTFVNEFQQLFKEDVIIVIDDLHNLEGEWLTSAFDILIDNIPDNMHIIIMSRQIPHFNLTYLSAKRKLLKVEMNNLNFSRDEIGRLLQNIYSISYSAKDIDILETKLSGWITGIHLVLQAYGKEFTKIKFEKLKIPENIFNFFADEIFRKLDGEIQNFLLNTALLDNFDADICNWMLGIKDSSTVLDELLSKNIFIQATPDLSEETPHFKTYNYQLLFKKFLVSKLYETNSKSKINNLLKKAFRYYKNHNEIVPALNYLLLAGEFRTAVPLIIKNFERLYDEGKYEVLWKWLSSINDEIINKNYYLLYYRNLLQKFFVRDIEGSLPYVERAIKLLEKGKNNQFLIDCYISRADTLLSLGKTEDAIKNLLRLVDKKTSIEKKAKLLYYLAFAYYKISKYDETLRLLFKSLDLCKQKNLKGIYTDIYVLLGKIYLIMGEYTKSTFYYEQIVDRAIDVKSKFEIISNLVLLYSQSDNYEKARDCLEKTRELRRLFPIPIFNIAYLIAKQAYRYEYGDYEENIRILEEFNSIALKLNHKYYIYLSYSLLSDSYYFLNKLTKAEEYYELAHAYLDEKNEHGRIEYNCMKAQIQKKIKINSSVEKNLLEAYNFYDTNKFVYNKAQTAYHLADYYLKTGMPESAFHYLEESLSISAEKGYISHIQREFLDSRLLFDFALLKGIRKDFVRNIIDSVFGKLNAEWLSKECIERLSSSINKLYDLKVTTFGTLEIKVRGNIIPESKWVKKKRKLILIYLLLSPKKELTKDKIIEIFYPDTPLESAENLFHQSISIVRSLLTPGMDDGQAAENNDVKSKNLTRTKKGSELKSEEVSKYPSMVIYEDKVLRLNPVYNIHADAIEFNKLYKSAIGSKTEMKIEYSKRAIDLYNGEFLNSHYEPWCEDMRQNFSDKFITLSEELIAALYRKELYEDIVTYAEKLLQYDRLNETAHLKLIETYAKLKRVNKARDMFAKMLRVYKEEINEKPSPDILEKIKNILS